jgi:hypothetical protein
MTLPDGSPKGLKQVLEERGVASKVCTRLSMGEHQLLHGLSSQSARGLHKSAINAQDTHQKSWA